MHLPVVVSRKYSSGVVNFTGRLGLVKAFLLVGISGHSHLSKTEPILSE